MQTEVMKNRYLSELLCGIIIQLSLIKRKTEETPMADIMAKVLMKAAKVIGKGFALLIIWTAHKLESK